MDSSLEVKSEGLALAEARQGLPSIAERARALEIKGLDELTVAAESIAIASKIVLALEAERKGKAKPLLDEKKKLDERYNSVADKFAAIVSLLKDKVIAYRFAETKRIQAEEARLAEERRAAEEAKKKEDEAAGVEGEALDLPDFLQAPPPPPPPTSIRTASGAIHTRKRWVFEIEDGEKIPRAFLAVDRSKINEAIRLGAREIPGVKIWEEEEVTAR